MGQDFIERREDLATRIESLRVRLEMCFRACYGNGQPSEFQFLHNRISEHVAKEAKDVEASEELTREVERKLEARIRELEEEASKREGMVVALSLVSGAFVSIVIAIFKGLLH